MSRTVLVTGSTDGIGLQTARMLAERGHRVVLHGRDPDRLERARSALRDVAPDVDAHLADLSVMREVAGLAAAVAERHPTLDVLVNNAGVLRAPTTRTVDGLDVRFAVNTVAPYLLTRRMLPLLGAAGRVVNVSSAAQAPVDLRALAGQGDLSDGDAYAQSKLALTMWSAALARELGEDPVVVAVNPGSLLGTKMVRDGFGVAGGDVGKGADVLTRAAVAEEFADASGAYYDNDAGRFGRPHPDALDAGRCQDVVRAVEAVLARTG